MRCKLSSYRRVSKDIGPCAYVGCSERACYVIVLLAEGCEARTWACADHAQTLGANPSEAAVADVHAPSEVSPRS